MRPWTLPLLALALAAGCSGWRAEPPPAEVACPVPGRVHEVLDANSEVALREVDTNRDGRADALFFVRDGKTERAEIDLDFDGATDLWISYDGLGRPVEWEALPPATRTDALPSVSSGRLPDDPPPPDLARLIPGLDPPIDPDCLTRPEVRAYLQDVKARLFGSWVAPASARATHTTVRFSLDRGGAVVGACVKEADDPAVAASVVRALAGAPRLPPMPERALCLARHPLLGTFGLEQH